MELIDHLKLLGFTTYEAKAYIALLKQDNSTGYEVAKLSGIPASKIYEVLNKLQEREVIMALGTDPKRYIPFPPEEILKKLQAQYLHSITFLQEKLEEIYEKDGQDQHYIWNISGEVHIFRKLEEILSTAQSEIFISIWAEELSHLHNCLKQQENRGIKIFMVLFGESEYSFHQTFRHGREHEIRQERKARRLAAVVDNKSMVVANFKDDGLTTAAYTLNKGMVLLTKDYIIHDIYTIKMQKKFGPEAYSIFEKLI
ncbi:MAG: helix-turn-helix domain-containing protein [Calditrichia bacterium]